MGLTIAKKSYLDLRVLECGNLFLFLEDFSLVLSDGRAWVVPKGFVFDATSSRIGKIYIGQFGPWIWAAAIHDLLYTVRGCSRREADKVMYDILKASGVRYWLRKLMYKVVRLFGHNSWNKPAPKK